MKINECFLKQRPLNSFYSQPHNADTHSPQCRHTPTTKPRDARSLPKTCSKLFHTQHTKCTVTLKWTVLRLLTWSVRNS